jgi:hypothetical protein
MLICDLQSDENDLKRKCIRYYKIKTQKSHKARHLKSKAHLEGLEK